MRISIKMLCVLPLALLGSCAFVQNRVHEPIAASAVESLEVGDSAQRVTELLGAPTEVVQLGSRSAYRYDFTEAKSMGVFLILVSFYNTDSHQDRVWVFLDSADRVSHVGSTLAGDQAEYSMPWSDN